MELKSWLSAPFKFAPIPVSVLAVLLYGVVFASVLVTDQTPAVAKDLGGLNLNQAYDDLHRITSRPHPYISHANDDVRNYLLSRLRPIVASQDYIHLSNDLTSNATYHTGKSAIYFEGTNILVKIDGTDASVVKSDGVLFSAHYDSVSTAPGATDDGMAVVTLLQMVEYLSKPIKRPRRTAVFFFNNGEEDGLNGAHVFFEHPWSNLTTSFINLEGAAAGGRPMLFRSTSLSAARSLRGPGVMHPHGTVLSADAFARGVIRSGTDYSIYAQGMKEQKDGLSGVDIAFYKNRAFYHTPLDSIPGMGKNEGRRSLWAMMETTKGAGLAMLNEDEGVGSGDTGVYFDVLGRIMVAFSLRTLFVLNVVLLILGPLVVIGLLAWVLILSNKYARRYEEPELTQGDRLKRVLVAAMGWGRFWLALLLAIGLHISLVAGYVKLNPFIFHSKPYLVLTTILALSFLSISLPLSLLNKLWPSPPSSQKFAIVLELYFISWVFLVFATVAVNNIGIGGLYFVTAWNLCTWAAAVSAVAEAAVRAGRGGEEGGKGEFDLVGEQEVNGADPGDHRYVRGVMYQAPPEEEDGDSHQESEPVETDPTEITPLMHQQRRRSTGGGEYVVGIDNEAVPVSGLKKRGSGYVEFGWWIAQMVALVPLPAVLLFQIVLLLVHSLNNTLVDGSSPVTAYGGAAALSLLIFLNLAPFSHKIHHVLNILVLVVFVICLIVAWTAFPFTQEAPLKLFFQQSVELDAAGFLLGTSHNHARTFLTGPQGYVDKMIVPDLPSSWGKDIRCQTDETLRKGLLSCAWESGLWPSPGGNASASLAPETLMSSAPATSLSDWMEVTAERVNASSGRISIKGTNTRGCRLYFNKPIKYFHVREAGRLQPGYELPDTGVMDVMLWSRNWENNFVVDFGWGVADPDVKMEGRAACIWAEYASSTAGSPHSAVSAQIPALEEVIHFLPLWATVTKWTYGLVEAWTQFSI